MTPPHREPRLVLLVAAGGMLGTGARYVVASALPTAPLGLPAATLLVNVVGAFLLGLLAEALVRRSGPGGVDREPGAATGDPERRRALVVRLALGTGALGGFTTFSSLAIELERLLAGGATGTAVLYAAASLTLGLAAALGGVVLGAAQGSRRTTGPRP